MVNNDQSDCAKYNSAMPRELVWMDQSRLLGWGCSKCAWVFNPFGPPTGDNFNAMMRNFESQRDKELHHTFARITPQKATRPLKRHIEQTEKAEAVPFVPQTESMSDCGHIVLVSVPSLGPRKCTVLNRHQ
jgi:hypothetical protein